MPKYRVKHKVQERGLNTKNWHHLYGLFNNFTTRYRFYNARTSGVYRRSINFDR